MFARCFRCFCYFLCISPCRFHALCKFSRIPSRNSGHFRHICSLMKHIRCIRTPQPLAFCPAASYYMRRPNPLCLS